MLLEKLLEKNNIILSNKLPLHGALVLLNDGQFIDLVNNALNGLFTKYFSPEVASQGSHKLLDKFIKKDILEDSSLGISIDNNITENFLVYTDNCVYLNDGINSPFKRISVILPNKKLSDAQYLALENWLQTLSEEDRSDLTIYISHDNVVDVNFSINDSNNLVDIIKNNIYYNTEEI